VSTLAPQYAGKCGAQMSDQGQEPWLAVVGDRRFYLVCPQCELEAMPTLLSNVGGEQELIWLPHNRVRCSY
jgi:hypothetical protein